MLSTFQIGLASLALVANVASTPIPAEVTQIHAPTQPVSEVIVDISRKRGVRTDVALTIAECESTKRQFNDKGEVLRGRENSQDVGVFQINEKYHLEKSQELGYDIYTTTGNIEYAMYLLETSGRAPWVHSKPCWGPKLG